MTNFVKELIKYFHPDNVDTGNGEKFIKLMNQIENDKLEFIVNLSLKDAICGKTLTIGNEQFVIEPYEVLDPKLICKKFISKDGTKFNLRFLIDLTDSEEDLEIKFISNHTSLVKTIEINAFDAFFGGKRVYFELYGNKKYIKLKPFIKLNNGQEILSDKKVNGIQLYIKFKIKESDKDIEFINQLRKIYEGCKC